MCVRINSTNVLQNIDESREVCTSEVESNGPRIERAGQREYLQHIDKQPLKRGHHTVTILRKPIYHSKQENFIPEKIEQKERIIV